MEVKTSFEINGTLVANEFIDRYMAAANGEYVKVYLYLVRHQRETVDVDRIADALNHTEADVRRALAYWEKMGAIWAAERTSATDRGTEPGRTPAAGGEDRTAPASASIVPAAPVSVSTASPSVRGTGSWGAERSAAEAETAAGVRPSCTPQQLDRLGQDEEFSQLLYIAQKYMNKIFVQRDCEVFAYLYDTLHMSAELLEYLVEYCAQEGHTSLRYIETVALSWHKKGFATSEEARAYTSTFSKNSFAVMRAFGLTDRGPGAAEKEMIERWFMTYGFSKELVLEACRRTLDAIHSPSFRYADKILSEWKKAGVKGMADVKALDEKRQSRQRTAQPKKPANKFHNFEQRDTDYDSMVLNQAKTWISEP